MDNITHTLIGLTVAKSIKTRNSREESGVFWASVLANNGADLDFLISFLFEERWVGYLLHHRGHTHTLIFAPLQALLLTGVLIGLQPRWRGSWRKILAVSLIGSLLHLFADFWNDYGLHPFWPFNNSWFYGDAIYIMEPLIWFCLAPLALFGLKKKSARLLWWALATALFYFAVKDRSWPFFGLLLAWWILFCRLQRPRIQPLWAWGGLCGVLLIFSTGSLRSQTLIEHALSRHNPSIRVLDLVRRPSAGTPWCWSVIALTQGDQDTLTTHFGHLSLAPRWISAQSCQPVPTPLEPLATPSSLPSTPQIHWWAEVSQSRRQLQSLAQDSCRFQAVLKYARLPFLWRNNSGALIAGDLRYDLSRGSSFSKLDISSHRPCLPHLPPWTPRLKTLQVIQ